MSIAIDPTHKDLAGAFAAAITGMDGIAAARAAMNADKPALPEFWSTTAELGWLGMHIPEEFGGGGAGLFEAVLLMEALGDQCVPGPYLPTVLGSAVIDACGSDEVRERWLPGLAEGTTVAAVGLSGQLSRAADGTIEGSGGQVLGADFADVLLLSVDDDLIVLGMGTPGIDSVSLRAMDRGLGCCEITLSGVVVPAEDVIVGGRRRAQFIGRVLAAAHAAGGAAAVQRMALEYAKVRVQFGRTIGSFQAVKHMCADMLVNAECASAVVWDAARLPWAGERSELAGSVAATTALPGFMRNSELNIQVHGGIGFTWEHNAHLYLRRAATLAAIFDPHSDAASLVTDLVSGGVTRDGTVPLPESADSIRAEVEEYVRGIEGRLPEEQMESLAASGFLMPEWPKPWGRGASALEQYVIKEATRSLPKPIIDVPWVPMTIGQLGTTEQAERYLPGTLLGSIQWCQLSSEPDAGSDLAGVRTRATKVDGGWLLNGQKVWTSHAATATHGLATVRTNPDVPKHAGISMMIVDMASPGIDIRPLEEIVPGSRPSASDFGDTSFNEVFFKDVFVPDSDLLGSVDQGWSIVRELLANERVTIGERKSPVEVITLVDLLNTTAPGDAGFRRDVGSAVAEEHTVHAMNLRRLCRAMLAAPPTAEANVIKIVNSERIQRIAATGMRILGTRGVDENTDFGWLYLRSRFTTIGGGTSQIARNQVAERVLGLPRER
jgi:alkylation response protein AidB-like acyl-CoA dehydrogenase